MSVRRSPWTPGIPCWVDLTTPNVAASETFYGAVLGWDAASGARSDDHDGYLVLQIHEAAVLGMLDPLSGGPWGWTVHLATDAVHHTLEVALASGATLVSPAVDIGRLGRRAVVADPQGHPVGLWQGGALNGSQLVNEPGGLCWEELRTLTPAAAVAFYQELFDYIFEPEPAYGPDYTSFRLSGEQVGLAGVRAVNQEPVPPGWLPFFGVRDADAAVQLALEHGGSVVLSASTTPRDRVAYLADPAGNAFAVLTSTGAEQPDRSG